MKIAIKCFAWLQIVSAIALMSSCTTVYFVEPVPKNTPDLNVFPGFISGLYEVTGGNLLDNDKSIMHIFIRFERLGDTRLVASLEAALPVSDLHKMEKLLADAQSEGEVLEYMVSEKLIYYLLAPNEEGEKKGLVVHLEKAGRYYFSPEWKSVTHIFDLDKGKHLTFEGYDILEFGGIVKNPGSALVEESPLVTKGLKDEIWFSIEKALSQWSLFYVKQTSKNELLIKTSLGFDRNHFDKHRERYEAIVPFHKNESADYIIQPDEHQLAVLLADPKLFGYMRLKKMRE